jgi:transposase
VLIWDEVPRSRTSQDLLTVLQDVPRRNGRLVVVMDNGSIHISHVIKNALPELKAEGVGFDYLPPYSPDLNRIECVFSGVKHHDLTERSYVTVPELMDAIDDAFTKAEDRLLARSLCEPQLRPAA